MISVGTYQAKTHLAQLLERVERGETVLVTRHGKPIARIVPASDAGAGRDPAELGARFAALRRDQKPVRAGDGPIWRLKHEDHKF